MIAFAAGFGKIRWRTRLGPTESSPLVANGLVYVGDWRGRVYALDEKTGRVRWTFQGKGRSRARSPSPATASTSARTSGTSTR